MDLLRKHSTRALFFVALAIYLLFPLSLTYNENGLVENIPLNGITHLSYKGLHVFPGWTVDLKLAQGSGRRGCEAVLCKARTILPEDEVEKLLHLQSIAVLAEYPSTLMFLLTGLFVSPLAGHAALRGFHLSYSGLSPPPDSSSL